MKAIIFFVLPGLQCPPDDVLSEWESLDINGGWVHVIVNKDGSAVPDRSYPSHVVFQVKHR